MPPRYQNCINTLLFETIYLSIYDVIKLIFFANDTKRVALYIIMFSGK